jgi:MFS family permease
MGMVLITAGMAVFTQVGTSTSYTLLIGALFVMGLGLGSTMMPIMTAALQTLTNETVARGSTLMNIVQQAAGSIGTALMSVVLTAQQKPALTASSQLEAFDISARAFGTTFMVALVLIVITFVPAFFLPRTKHVSQESAPPIVMH